jgi:hypothetical protein
LNLEPKFAFEFGFEFKFYNPLTLNPEP